MSESIQKRWLLWDKLHNNGQYEEIVKQFDERLEKGFKIVVGDIIRRNHALEALGVTVTDKDFGMTIKAAHNNYLKRLN